MTRRARLARPLTSSARPHRRNRRDRHGDPGDGPLTIEWDERGTYSIVAGLATPGGEPSVAVADPPEGAQLEDVTLWPGPAPSFAAWGAFWAWPARPARPWVQHYPRRRGHGSRPGSGRSNRNR